MYNKQQITLANRELIIETGKLAKQANGSVIITYGDTVVLAAAAASKDPVEGIDFFPLSVEYREKAYAAGKIPGGFFKREGRPSENEILTSRLIDRPIRPLFPDNFRNEVQIIVFVLSADKENDPGILGIIGASAALSISDIPFHAPIGAVRIGRVDGNFIINPTFSEIEESDIDLVIAGSKDSIIMVEGEAREISEADMIATLEHGHAAIKEIVALQEKIVSKCGKSKIEIKETEIDNELVEEIKNLAQPKVEQIINITEKKERTQALVNLVDELETNLEERFVFHQQIFKL